MARYTKANLSPLSRYVCASDTLYLISHIGAGPTGLNLFQLVKLNGAQKVTLAANKGIKMDICSRRSWTQQTNTLSATNRTQNLNGKI
jgi:hypothetical protein